MSFSTLVDIWCQWKRLHQKFTLNKNDLISKKTFTFDLLSTLPHTNHQNLEIPASCLELHSTQTASG